MNAERSSGTGRKKSDAGCCWHVRTYECQNSNLAKSMKVWKERLCNVCKFAPHNAMLGGPNVLLCQSYSIILYHIMSYHLISYHVISQHCFDRTFNFLSFYEHLSCSFICSKDLESISSRHRPCRNLPDAMYGGKGPGQLTGVPTATVTLAAVFTCTNLVGLFSRQLWWSRPSQLWARCKYLYESSEAKKYTNIAKSKNSWL